MTAGDHFERVAVVYESLRTTDEAPVRAIGQLLPGRPVTGLDIGCGTGRYTRLLRALLPDGSGLAAADVSAAMLAQLRAASRGHARGWCRCWRPPNSCRCGPPAWTWSPRSTACTTSTWPASWPPPPGCCSPAASCSSTPAPRSRTRGRSGAATSPVSPSTSSACTARPRSGTPSGGPMGSHSSQHRPSGTRARARPSGSGPRPGAPLLDILLLHAAGAARRHRDLPGPPARPRGLLG